jgi:predicted esterase
MPPVLLMHGRKDTRVKPYHTENFVIALQHAGIQHQVNWNDNIEHIKIVSSFAASLRFLNPSYQDIIDFLNNLDDK